MALTGKLIMYVDINSHEDMFHDLITHRPKDIASISPEKVHGCDILDGHQGSVGSISNWDYTLDGEKGTVKVIIEEIDETNHKLVQNIVEGHLVEGLFKSFKITFHIEPKGDRQLAIWTIEFEKLNTSVPYPTSFMNYVLDLTKEMDAHNISQ